MHEAAALLQRLLRGRATQNQMFAGKQANLALIRVSSVQSDDWVLYLSCFPPGIHRPACFLSI